VQYIKLAVQECGLGKEWVRAPRLQLVGEERNQVLKIIHDGIARRPAVPTRSASSKSARVGGARKSGRGATPSRRAVPESSDARRRRALPAVP
jgi:hypothetical protein